MNNIRIRSRRSRPVSANSISIAPADGAHQTLRALSEHMGSGFGGALLAPHISTNDLQNILKPALHGIKHRINEDGHKSKLMQMQNRILSRNPGLRSKIQGPSGKTPDQMSDIQDPFENMDNRQLYHHVMQLPKADWHIAREVAGQLAGKHPSVFATNEQMPQILRHVRDRYNMGGGTNTGGQLQVVNPTGADKYMPSEDVRSHLADISITHSRSLAAQRLEHEPQSGGGYAQALKASLYGSRVAPLKVNNPM